MRTTAEKPQARALSSPPFLVTFIGTLPNTFQDTILLIFPISWGRRVYYYYTHFLSEETEACASRDPACKWRARGGNLNHSASVPPTPWALPPPLCPTYSPGTLWTARNLRSDYNQSPKLHSQHKRDSWRGKRQSCPVRSEYTCPCLPVFLSELVSPVAVVAVNVFHRASKDKDK